MLAHFIDVFMTLQPWELFFFAWSLTAGYYFGMAGGLYLLLYRWRPAWLGRRKIQGREPSRVTLSAEIKAGALATVVMAAVLALTFWCMQQGYTRVSRQASVTALALGVSVGLAILCHDLYFYAVHRLLHTPWLFRRVHAIHHRNMAPTPWSTFAFHPVEALLNSLFLPLAAFLVPAHPLAFAIFLVIQGLFNAIGHTGFEFFPAAWRHGAWTSASHHDAHHRVVHANFGLYLSLWDKIFKTARPFS